VSIARLRGQTVDARLWTPVEQIESQALTQLRNIASLPWVAHVAVMPDVHFGKGATVGSVIAMRGAVSPAAVGVDIGCGMGAVRTSLDAAGLPESLRRIRSDLESAIPVGFAAHLEPVKPRDPRLKAEVKELLDGFAELDPAVKDLGGRAAKQLGTLGGGNHFIELCVDTEARVWLMLHSGSRNIGKSLAEVHMGRAKKLKHNRALADPDLAVFLAGTEEMDTYRRDLDWAQRYAMLNRRLMFDLYMDVIRRHFPQVRSTSRCSVTTTTSPRRPTTESRCWSPGKAPSPRAPGSSASSPARWERAATSSGGWATPNHCTQRPTAPDGRCPAARRSGSSA